MHGAALDARGWPAGIRRAKGPRPTVPGNVLDTRPHLVDRAFAATAPNQLWPADITYCRTSAGWVYVAFVIGEGLKPLRTSQTPSEYFRKEDRSQRDRRPRGALVVDAEDRPDLGGEE